MHAPTHHHSDPTGWPPFACPQANRPIKDAPEAREMTEGEGGEAEDDSDLLRTHLDSLELYVPPLTSTLLNSMYEQSAERVTVRTSTRRTRVDLT